jgi:adenylosuccinate lyase
MIAPDATVTLDFALNRLIGLVENLIVYPENMQKNLDQLNGLIFSQRVLLALIDEAGVSREDAYKIVQRNAMKVWSDKVDFFELLLSDQDVAKAISKEKLKEIFDISYYSKNVDRIFDNIF